MFTFLLVVLIVSLGAGVATRRINPSEFALLGTIGVGLLAFAFGML